MQIPCEDPKSGKVELFEQFERQTNSKHACNSWRRPNTWCIHLSLKVTVLGLTEVTIDDADKLLKLVCRYCCFVCARVNALPVCACRWPKATPGQIPRYITMKKSNVSLQQFPRAHHNSI